MRPARTPERSLAEEFEASFRHTKALAERLVEERLDYERACYPSLPRETLMAGLTKHRDCRCVVALEAIERDKQRV